MSKISQGIDFINVWTAKLVMWLIIPLIFALVYEVILRYWFNRPTTWSQDLTWMIYGTHYLMGAGYTLYIKGHIAIDVFYRRFSPLWKAIIHVVCYLILFFPIMGAFVYKGVVFAYASWAINEVSQYSPWRPILFPFKSIMVVGFALLFLQGVSELIRLITVMVRKGEQVSHG